MLYYVHHLHHPTCHAHLHVNYIHIILLHPSSIHMFYIYYICSYIYILSYIYSTIHHPSTLHILYIYIMPYYYYILHITLYYIHTWSYDVIMMLAMMTSDLTYVHESDMLTRYYYMLLSAIHVPLMILLIHMIHMLLLRLLLSHTRMPWCWHPAERYYVTLLWPCHAMMLTYYYYIMLTHTYAAFYDTLLRYFYIHIHYCYY